MRLAVGGRSAWQSVRLRSTMAYSPPYTYMEADALAEVLRARAAKPRAVAVVDVRDDDFVGGHIPGVVHAPSAAFNARVDSLVKELAGYEQVVFHCSLSQQRGPKAARIYKETREGAHAKGTLPTDACASQRISVLQDGFAHFGQKFKKDKDLVQDWDEEAWSFR